MQGGLSVHAPWAMGLWCGHSRQVQHQSNGCFLFLLGPDTPAVSALGPGLAQSGCSPIPAGGYGTELGTGHANLGPECPPPRLHSIFKRCPWPSLPHSSWDQIGPHQLLQPRELSPVSSRHLVEFQDLQAYCVLALCGRKAPQVCSQGTRCVTGTVSSLEIGR